MGASPLPPVDVMGEPSARRGIEGALRGWPQPPHMRAPGSLRQPQREQMTGGVFVDSMVASCVKRD